MKKFLIVTVIVFVVFFVILSNQVEMDYDFSFTSLMVGFFISCLAIFFTLIVVSILSNFIDFEGNNKSKGREDRKERETLKQDVSSKSSNSVVKQSPTTGANYASGSTRGVSYSSYNYYSGVFPEPEFKTFGEDYVNEWYQWEERTPEYLRARVGGHIIEFKVVPHKYLVDGTEVPSVSTLVERSCSNPYTSVPADVLRNAKNKGTAMHNAVEDYEINGVDDGSQEVRGYKFLKDLYSFKPIATELMVAYFIDERPVCAGRIDFLLEEDSDSYGILDLKRTSEYYSDRVETQMNLYRLCLAQSSGKSVTNLSCLRLRGYVSEHHEVSINEQKASSILMRL